MGVVILILGILLTADAMAVAVMLDGGLSVSLAVGIFLMLWGFNYKSLKEGNGFMKFLNVVFTLFLAYVVGMSCFLAAYGAFPSANYAEDYAVVLGSAVRNSQPMPDLSERLRTAADYSNKNLNASIIVSGGQGSDENVSEAEVMYAYLVGQGVSEERIIKEDRSTNTRENFTLSDAAVLGALKNSSVVAITSNYHVFRARMYADQCGIDAHTLGAPTKWYLIPVSYVRETIAMIKLLWYYIPFDAIM